MKLKQNKQSKLVIALSAVILLLVALSATLTFAYFTAKAESSEAKVTFGELSVALSDTSFYQDGSTTAIVNGDLIVPGCKIAVKDDTKINVTTNIKTLLRIKFDVTCADLSADQFKVATLATEDWATNTDGYVYYLQDISANAGIDISALSVEFLADKIGNDLKGKQVTVKLTVEVIQEEHNLNGTKNATNLAAAFANYTENGVKASA